ncbi:ATP-binding cassette domain-containing protein [Nonomuraea turcica]|uniref:ATP-binding cassette domain-containing protein n=1 Tax=Nonomuraea sp. G32 TaxID=3067274 RepID=UPI00273C6285|nr:ATP-binding cassette domain-containing protein [Nonomuraea sp. G32]MDP4504959.1 ATP-binding cassette domain-containing protein [Nonomuraea sp. G32]
MSGTPFGSGPERRARALAGAGLGLAVLAELSSAGLLGLSGWFVSACAVAGAATFSSFSFIVPSGGVRALALARIAGNYSTRLTLHAAALRRVATARADLFRRAATSAQGSLDHVWSGDLLDRSMADADEAGTALIRSTAPAVVAAASAAMGVLAVALATSLVPAAVLVAGVAIVALMAYRTSGAAQVAEQHARMALRAETVTVTDAWAEMASLGAAGQLAARMTVRFSQLDAARDAVSRRRLRTALVAGLAGVATVAAAAIIGGIGADPATFVFVALMAVGVVAQAEQWAGAAEARSAAAAARRRLLGSAPPPHALDEASVPPMRSWAAERGIGFGGYRLPPALWRPGRVIGGRAIRGGVLVVTGRSGSGKSTLLRALATSLHQSLEADGDRPAVTAVAADDYLFTGTLGSNWRLADPALTDEYVDERLAALRLDRSGLTARTPVGPGGRELSGGELRRVYLGRALATRPHVLIVDEPVTGLDDDTARHVLGILANLPDTVVVIAAHEVPETLRSLDHVSTLPLD